MKAYWAETRRKIPEEAKGNAKRSRKTSKKSANLTAQQLHREKTYGPKRDTLLSKCLLASIFTSTSSPYCVQVVGVPPE
jgi:hypothetical protein